MSVSLVSGNIQLQLIATNYNLSDSLLSNFTGTKIVGLTVPFKHVVRLEPEVPLQSTTFRQL